MLFARAKSYYQTSKERHMYDSCTKREEENTVDYKASRPVTRYLLPLTIFIFVP